MKTKLLGVVAACVLALSVEVAHADIFNVSASFAPDPSLFDTTTPIILSGTFSINDGILSPGSFLSLSQLPALPQQPGVGRSYTDSSGWIPGVYELNAITGSWDLNGGNGVFANAIRLTLAGDFDGYAGGALLSGFAIAAYETCGGRACGQNQAIFRLLNGTVTDLTVIQTPLPTTLPLFATGLGALGLLGWRRKRKGGERV